ncbi:phage tail protein [Undibacterium flavidum]|uniref:Phage tail protein n=1 Tax=Undibacterium flavidum TaxID=2762297 RepID=A0ABR6YAK7_9BURK|nr:tail fiber protein [Undibacterium flavidum]MBC3873664.1 phage tail protein [Undibacterium flavidum]
MSNPFIAEIRMVPFNFAPTGWAFCDGQLLPISQNTALFALLGTTYGGDGESTFALPNLQGSAIMHPGQGPGLSLHDLGEVGGTESVTLLSSEIPSHNHRLYTTHTVGTTNSPSGTALAVGAKGTPLYGPASGSPDTMHASTLAVSGGSQPHNNMQPYLTLTFIIALQGIFPPR